MEVDYRVDRWLAPAIAPPQLHGFEVVNKMPNGVDARQLWKDPSLSTLASYMRAASNRGLIERDFDFLRRRFSYEIVGPQLLESLTTT